MYDRADSLLASAALTSFAAVDLPAALGAAGREIRCRRSRCRRQQSRKPAKPAGRDGQSARRAAARRPAPAPVAPKPVVPAATAQTPLNTNAVAESASRLGLTVRETPATVEVISAETMREQGYRTVSEVAQGAVGVTSGDNPAEPAAFSMRGFTNSQINMLYNGIKIGPQNMTSRITDTANLAAVEFLKGPASLMSGEGAAGGAINLVTKQPHTGPIRNEADFSWDSLNSFGVHYGSGGSTNVQGLDYRFDISRSSLNGFADDTNTKTLDVSGQLNYRISDSLKIWGAIEYREDRSQGLLGRAAGADRLQRLARDERASSPATTSRTTTDRSWRCHDRRPHLQHQLQRPRQPQRRAGGVAARRLRAEAGARPDAEEPGLWLWRGAHLVQQRDRGVRFHQRTRWIASASMSRTASALSATSPT